METRDDKSRPRTFHTDRRSTWRVTWTLAWAFLTVSWLMQREGAALWPVFAGTSLLLLALGGSALVARSLPLLGVAPEGLRVFAGARGLGHEGGFAAQPIPWSAIASVRFETREAAAQRGEIHPQTVPVLCFRLHESASPPAGSGGLAERLSGRSRESALGEHFVWNADERALDLLTPPRGGHARLTAAIERVAPRLGDASSGRRPSLGGPVAYALYDAGVAFGVGATLLLWATGRMDVVVHLARGLLAWGGRIGG